MNSIQTGPHYEIQSTELAKWLDNAAPSSWWNVDGDPLLTGRVPFPCPTDELTAELRKIDRPLLAQANKDDSNAKGQRIDAAAADRLAARFKENLHTTGSLPDWAEDRFFYLCWKDTPREWMLAEDSVTARQFSEAAAADTK